MNRSPLTGDQAYDHVEACRFTGPVWSQQADDLAAVDREADVLYDPARAIGFG